MKDIEEQKLTFKMSVTIFLGTTLEIDQNSIGNVE